MMIVKSIGHIGEELGMLNVAVLFLFESPAPRRGGMVGSH